MEFKRTSVEIPSDLYQAFKAVGGNLAHLTRDAIRDYIGIKGASEESLGVLELKLSRLEEDKLNTEKRLSELMSLIEGTRVQIDTIKFRIDEKQQASVCAKIMRDKINPYLRGVNYQLNSVSPDLHEMLLELREHGLEHDLESLQKHAIKLESADYLLDIRSVRS